MSYIISDEMFEKLKQIQIKANEIRAAGFSFAPVGLADNLKQIVDSIKETEDGKAKIF